MNWELIKPIAAQGARDFLRTVGMALAAHGYITNGSPGVEAFIGAGMTLAGLFWGWFTTSGYLQVAALLKKLTATKSHTDAVKAAEVLPPAAAVDTALNKAAVKAVTNVLLVAFLASLFLAGTPAMAQKLGPIGTAIKEKIDGNKATSNSEVKLTGDPIADLQAAITKGGQKLIMHLKQSYALAIAKNDTGLAADNTSANCTKALVPIVDLVVNGPKAGTVPDNDPMALTAAEQQMASDTSEPEGPIVKIEKLRILRLSLQSPALNDACGALVQDEVKNAQGLIGKITSLVTGAGMVGIGL